MAELVNYQRRKLDSDLAVKYFEIQYLVYTLSIHLQYKCSNKYHINFALSAKLALLSFKTFGTNSGNGGGGRSSSSNRSSLLNW